MIIVSEKMSTSIFRTVEKERVAWNKPFHKVRQKAFYVNGVKKAKDKLCCVVSRTVGLTHQRRGQQNEEKLQKLRRKE
jgi:hypothetical protein